MNKKGQAFGRGFLLIPVVLVLLILIIIFPTFEERYAKDQIDIDNGIVTDIEVSAGGFGSPTKTTLTLDDDNKIVMDGSSISETDVFVKCIKYRTKVSKAEFWECEER